MTISDLKKEIPYKWRVQSFSRYKPQATCVAYIDARQVMDLLDAAVGPDNWQDKYFEINGRLFCRIGIKCNDEWVWKTDTGTESNTEKEKGQVSDAFKRAAVKWGVGRFLYSIEMVRIDAGEKKGNSNYPHVVDKQGKRVYDLTKHINKNILGISEVDHEKEWDKASEQLEKTKTLEDLARWAGGIKGKFHGKIKEIATRAYFDKMHGILIDIVDTCKTAVSVDNFLSSHNDHISRLPDKLKSDLQKYCDQIKKILVEDPPNIQRFTSEIKALNSEKDIRKWISMHAERVKMDVGYSAWGNIVAYAEKRIKEINRKTK
jgi:hypothetical protein